MIALQALAGGNTNNVTIARGTTNNNNDKMMMPQAASANAPGRADRRDLRSGLLRRGWLQNTRLCLKQHGKRHRCNTETTCNHLFLKPPPLKPTPYASPKTVRPVHLLIVVLLRVPESNFPGDSL